MEAPLTHNGVVLPTGGGRTLQTCRIAEVASCMYGSWDRPSRTAAYPIHGMVQRERRVPASYTDEQHYCAACYPISSHHSPRHFTSSINQTPRPIPQRQAFSAHSAHAPLAST